MYGVMKMIPKRCAIYTRKSTDERLDMEFNTLDAQRDSCLNYIASQKSEGWVPVLEEYDDGGYSGGSMDRPALTRLLDDIKANRVDIVVVYKIDRLTRSLADFSKLVEIFDKHDVTFVSITQSFNTTTSMGRLTLNVLLSFAQFEREVASERIRDKIAASKRKGMWTGGTVPLGYDVVDRKLVLNKEEAKRVAHIFKRYIEVGNLSDLYRELNEKGIRSKGKKGEAVFCASSLHYLLTNPIYIGKVRYKKEVYDGQHEAIISGELWQNVQDKLTEIAVAKRSHKKHSQKNLLQGKLFDSDGNRYGPVYTRKPNMIYRYYQLKQQKDEGNETIHRLSATEIEPFVEKIIRVHLTDLDKVITLFDFDPAQHVDLYKMISENQSLIETQDLINLSVKEIVVYPNKILICLTTAKLFEYFVEELGLISNYIVSEEKAIETEFMTRSTNKGAIKIEPKRNGVSDNILENLSPIELRNLVRGMVWREDHFNGMSLKEIANRDDVSDNYVGQMIFKSFALCGIGNNDKPYLIR